MIDFIKYYITDRDAFLNYVEQSGVLDLKGRFHFVTGEALDFPKTTFHNNMFVKITQNTASIKGSIHKYYNTVEDFGEQNYNDFSYCDCRYAITRLQNIFNTDKTNTKVTNLEFGLNIEVKQDPQELIDNYILMYDSKSPNRDEKFNGKGDFLEFQMTDYNLKIYNKSKQNNLKNRNILRVELKITRSRYLEKHFKIYSLNDLDRNRFNLLFKKLLEHFDKLLIVDTLFFKNDSRLDEMILFQNGVSPTYWKKLKNTEPNKVKNKFKNDFNEVLKSNGLLKTKKKLKVLLKEKYKELMNCDCDVLSNVA